MGFYGFPSYSFRVTVSMFFSPLIAFVASFFLWLLSRDMNMGAMASARVLHMRGRTFSRQTTEEFHELIRE